MSIWLVGQAIVDDGFGLDAVEQRGPGEYFFDAARAWCAPVGILTKPSDWPGSKAAKRQ